jgi:hypothetical protein
MEQDTLYVVMCALLGGGLASSLTCLIAAWALGGRPSVEERVVTGFAKDFQEAA